MRPLTWLDALAIKWLVRRHPSLWPVFERWVDETALGIQRQLTEWQKP